MYIVPELVAHARYLAAYFYQINMAVDNTKIVVPLRVVGQTLVDNSFTWYDAMMMMVQDQSIVDVKMLKQFVALHEEGEKDEDYSKQCKFRAVDLLLQSRGYQARFHPDAFNLALGYPHLKLRAQLPRDPDDELRGLVESSITDNMDELLMLIKIGWKQKDMDNLRVLVQAFGALVYFPSRLTKKGKEYLLRPGRSENDSLLLVVISVLYKSSSDKLVKEFLNAVYSLALIEPHSFMSDRLLLSFMVVNHIQPGKMANEFVPEPGYRQWSEFTDMNPRDLKKFQHLERGNSYKEDVLPLYDFMPDYDKHKHTVEKFNVAAYTNRFIYCPYTERPMFAENTFRKFFRGSLEQVFFLRSIEFLQSVSNYLPGWFKKVCMHDLIHVKY